MKIKMKTEIKDILESLFFSMLPVAIGMLRIMIIGSCILTMLTVAFYIIFDDMFLRVPISFLVVFLGSLFSLGVLLRLVYIFDKPRFSDLCTEIRRNKW